MTKKNRAVALTTTMAFSLVATSLHADRILVIGDSWAWPVAPELETVLHENGHRI